VPEQVNVYVEFAASAPVVWVPDVVLLPDHAPLAAHDVAFVLDHVSVEDPPDVIAAGDAVIVTVGADATETVTDRLAEPPVPVHVSV
jgi:hypothetical protein